MAYYIENGVMPCRLDGYKCLLFMNFYKDEICDLEENWFSANQQYQKERKNFKK